MPVNSDSRTAVLTLMAGFGLLIPASIGLLSSGGPTMLGPFPALTVLPAFLLVDWHLWKASVILPTLLFFAWCPGLFRGQVETPKRSYGLFAVATVLSVVYFVASWKWGLQYQGIRYTHIVCIVNIGWAAFLGLIFARSWNRPPSFRFNLFLHWMLFAWLAWYAFPYLGELP
jgi:hypothetical protein